MIPETPSYGATFMPEPGFMRGTALFHEKGDITGRYRTSGWAGKEDEAAGVKGRGADVKTLTSAPGGLANV
jgi:hypothetical protein